MYLLISSLSLSLSQYLFINKLTILYFRYGQDDLYNFRRPGNGGKTVKRAR